MATSCRRAFTLIELLVVIAIIAILAAILFPVFAQARESARKTTCASNLKQLSLAQNMYLQDYDENPVLSQTYDYVTNNIWLDLVQPYVKGYALMTCPDSPFRGTDQASYGYWYSYGSLPNSNELGGALDQPGFPYYVTRNTAWLQNYTKPNLQYNGIQGSAMAGALDNIQKGNFPSTPLAGVARPSEYAMIFDSPAFDGLHSVLFTQEGFGFCTHTYDLDEVTEYFIGFQPRHTGGVNTCDINTRATTYGQGNTNVAFLDGHVKTMKSAALLQENPSVPGTLLYWNPAQ